MALLALLPTLAAAAAPAASIPGIPAVSVSGPGGGQTYTLSLQVLALMTALTLLPAIV
ncbi:MAG: flagellar biosynthetic protein FliP, partial [Gammaproteobacteria bacterium]|nr:flagellar biosynthetic protein FliP [Gammaproteobacteria bacterium]